MAKSKKDTTKRKSTGTTKKSGAKTGTTSKRTTAKTTTAKRAASTRGKSSTKRKTSAKNKAADTAAAEAAVPVDRRTSKDRRKSDDRRKKDVPVATERRKIERRTKVNRRRQIDPTTCERDYSDDEVEFMNALDEYKRASGRMFPTCSEILEVVRKLGYRKQDPQAEQPPADSNQSTVQPATAPDQTTDVLADSDAPPTTDDTVVLAAPDLL